MNSEDVRIVFEKLITKLPISSLMLLLIMGMGEYGVINMYKATTEESIREMLAYTNIFIVIFLVVLAGILYVLDVRMISKYIKNINKEKKRKRRNQSN